MDSTTVNKELRRVVRPVLRELGSDRFTTRNSWRDVEPCVQVVNFQSFNAYTAQGVGCTPFSFSVNLGVYVRPQTGDPRQLATAKNPDRPQEYESTFRFRARKDLSQPWFHPHGRSDGSDRDEIWYVREDGSNLSEVVEDALAVITGPGLRQLSAYSDLEYAYFALLDYRNTFPPRSIDSQIRAVPCGGPDSAAWRSVADLMAFRIGRNLDRDMEGGVSPAEMESVLGRY